MNGITLFGVMSQNLNFLEVMVGDGYGEDLMKNMM